MTSLYDDDVTECLGLVALEEWTAGSVTRFLAVDEAETLDRADRLEVTEEPLETDPTSASSRAWEARLSRRVTITKTAMAVTVMTESQPIIP
jgi:hypothetical protein